jgi:antitoxin (DNA-binding transcriptional repressor) of toxin-antitoxin stability system
VTITRYGKPVAAIVNIEDLEQLQRLRAAKLTGELANLAEDWEDADEFAQELDNVIRDR